MLDHIFLSVSDVQRSVDFYTAALAPLGIAHQLDYDGKDGPPGHPDLKGFGANGRVFFWLRHGPVEGAAVHVGFVGAGAIAVAGVIAGAGVQPVSKTINATAAMKFLNAEC